MNRSPNPSKETRLRVKKKKKRTCQIVNLAISSNNRMKFKENKKRNKYLDITRELRNLWNMNVILIPIVIGALGTIPKGLERGLKELKIRG